MRFIKIFEEYDDFIHLLHLRLPKSGSYSIDYLNSVIKSYLQKVYSPFNWNYYENKDIEIPGVGILNSRYISLFINNQTIFRDIIKSNHLNSSVEFIDYVISNLDSIYHYNCEYFKNKALPIVISTVRRGNLGEIKTIEKFKEMTKSKGYDVEFEYPTTVEDISGIDSKLILNGRTYTLQIKPMTSKIIKDDEITIKSPGCLNIKKFGVVIDYLCFWSDNGEFVFLRNRGIKSIGDQFISPLKNLVL